MKVIQLMNELQRELEKHTKLNNATDFLNSNITIQVGDTSMYLYTEKTTYIGFLGSENGGTLIVGTLNEGQEGVKYGEGN